MNLHLKRTHHLPTATLGTLTFDDIKTDAIYTLENPKRATDKDSRIPAGTYTCKPYSGTKYKDVYILENVPNRSAILIHWGSYEEHTLGCILIGNKQVKSPKPAVFESKKCFERFRSLIGKNSFTLTIED
jgi:hypothetical protein